MLRPPLAVERLERVASGRLGYRMKTPWRDGRTQVIMSDGELLEKLAALVPAPRFHLVRYYVECRFMWSWSDKSMLPQPPTTFLLHIKSVRFSEDRACLPNHTEQ